MLLNNKQEEEASENKGKCLVCFSKLHIHDTFSIGGINYVPIKSTMLKPLENLPVGPPLKSIP